MNEVLLELLKSMINHLWLITLFMLMSSLLKKVLYIWVELQKAKIQNKDSLKIAQHGEDQIIIEIQSSHLQIKDLKQIRDENLISFKKSA